MPLIVIYILILGAAVLIVSNLSSLFSKQYSRLHKIHEQESERAFQKLEEMFVWVDKKKITAMFFLGPVVLGAVGFILFNNPVMAAIGAALGLVFPWILIKFAQKARKKKLQGQLLDALTSLSQSLKAGLSLLQAMKILVEDMPPPISQEFGLIIKENKMGKHLEDSFEELNKRMGIEELNLITTAILVARETGGNLAGVFARLSNTIRQKKKISEQVTTLTTQARWQGVIMSGLPIIFAIFVFRMNPDFFNVMLESDLGRILLGWCVISEAIGAFMLMRLSKVEV